ncbi:snapalysin [Streptoalloteichus tenebrarius]|uniref:Extracellular small neutral protease n=1 Tax=Streptoalloteichus tenebrarius (strain ATCC 17920 / DSM 40477 / JCM 4838 / CBS 697.72 / NBRC 16177 / NCIMB 11028 / NRRL B-12390 / A12253. 1 / ISP 5477) TaxID=1933 RepID=A0ABT1HZ11_STRSD|nr:snapalysin family zinc-dependent metalloprotease [Streptoalloteichus tenebrarius]MCP2260730.1 snapalysin [Streptoalloteichus tenebrarius]BFF03736.1 snapalysin family zinc-dependent metalloprotease [Streptoalloteichus tenebrarius]
MSVQRLLRGLVGPLALLLTVFGLQLSTAAAASAAPAQAYARTVYYSASAYSAEADQAARIWNSAAPNLRMVRGGNASIRIYATTGGGSRAYPCGLGCATIYIDTNDIAAGHNALRIVAHEIGHGLGLPDNYNGVCSYLMSGGSAGTSCRNPYPNSQEAARVNQLFGGGFVAREAHTVPDEDVTVYDRSLTHA